MALARMPQMGFDISSGSALGKAFEVLKANGPYLEAYKAQYGTPTGVTVTLGNGVQGHFTGEIDPASGQPLFYVDYTPPAFTQQVQANAAAVQAGAPAPYPPPVVYQPPAPPVFPGAPAGAPAPAAAAKPFLGIPPLALVAGGGLLVFLIARRL